MLKVPAYAYFEDLRVTVYQDDTMFWKFYVIPDYISVRRDQNDNPVFLLIKYAFGDQDRVANPALGRGGGFMAFDVEMRVAEQDQAALVQRLQDLVDDEYRRLKALAEAHNERVEGMRLSSWAYANNRSMSTSLSIHDVKLGLRPDAPEAPPGNKPPTVILSVPTWTEGTFSVSAPQAASLVSHRVVEGPLSLVGSNVASANMDLTEAGATFMEKTLVNRDGTGGSDLTPIQVRFDLKMWARLPPVRLSIEADTRSVYQGLRAVMHDFEGNECNEDELYHFDQHLKMAVESNLIKISFDTGTLKLDDKFVNELRATAMEIVTNLMEEKFFKKEDAPAATEDPVAMDDERKVYFFKSEQEMEFTSISYHEEIKSIAEWPVHPQGTMQSFFAGMSAAEIGKYVRVADLNDPFFMTLGLKVSAFADWEHNPIAFVEAQVQYEGRDENGDMVEKQQTFTFNKDSTRGDWDPSLIGAKREYQYRYRIAFQGKPPGEFTRWERERTPQLNLSIPDAGRVNVRLLAGQIDFAQTVDQVQVEVAYADTSSGVNEEIETFRLLDGQQEQTYNRVIFTNWDRPVRYRSHFFLKDGQRIETDWTETTARQLLINAPLYDKLDVRLVPSGDWSGVVQSVVSLRYEDAANNYRADEAFSLKAINEFKTWSVVLRNSQVRQFEYKVLTTFQNGDLREGEWTRMDGDQALPIVVRTVPQLVVKLLPNVVDFDTSPVVETTMRYADAANSIQKVETFTFVKGDKIEEWRVPIADNSPRQYRYQVTFHTADGRTVKEPEVVDDRTEVVLPRLLTPEIKVTLLPRFVSFIDTPVVEVSVRYEDAANQIRFNDSFLFTEPVDQVFRIPVRADSPTGYELQITYFNKDGTAFPQTPVRTDKKHFPLPRFVPELAPQP